MLGGSRQSNDIRGRLALLPIASDCVRSANAFEKRAGTHSAANLEIAEIVREVKQSVLKLDAGDILTDVNSFPFDFLSAHLPTLPRPYSERFESAPRNLNAGNLVTALTPADAVPFLPTAFFFRQTVEQFRLVTAATTPANDNEPWREAEAA